jgi:hypothetical protein
MASPLAAVTAEVRTFLAGGPFMSLWRAVMDATATVDRDGSLSDAERDWFDELYDAVHMGADDPVDALSRKDGVVGAGELREQLRRGHLDRF